MFSTPVFLFPQGKAENNAAASGGLLKFPEEVSGQAETSRQCAEEDGSAAAEGPPASESGGALPEDQAGDARARQVMTALAEAYPARIGRAELRDGDWAVPVMGEWFYYAQGRLLPGELKGKALEYDPQPFYSYEAELSPWKDPDTSESERLQNFSQRREENPPKRSHHFYDALWQAQNREEAYERVKSMRLFNRSVLVHYAVMEELAMVEARILRDAQTDPQIKNWINSIEVVSGWNWRSIADTQSRSFHAYGTAVDIMPVSSGKLETYWLWTSMNNSQWWMVPYAKRLHPPDKVIKAFEAYGFTWGGKWLLYDTMHFEYRPEIMLLNGLPINYY
ncbi:MAG: M15 family metallopeptidase [Treponema sp.]|jgi:hypothetical protein|nr:M15 family metallopeptidase [Treponema sp.]